MVEFGQKEGGDGGGEVSFCSPSLLCIPIFLNGRELCSEKKKHKNERDE